MKIDGFLTLSKPLDSASCNLINKLAETPRLARDVNIIGKQYGIEGEYYSEDSHLGVITPERPPVVQPSLKMD